MRVTWSRSAGLAALVGALVALRFWSAAHSRPEGLLTIQRPLMGTAWTIEVMDHGHPEQAREAVEQAYRELERIDGLMSEWKPASPISQVDAAAGKNAVEVPPELRELLERSIRYSQQTQGTFDVTWRGMENLWHFDDSFTVPSQAQVDAARKNVNFKAIQIQGNRVFLPAGVNIGLGGIAKGYAVDRASEVLARAGFTDSLVDGGGDVRVSGNRGGSSWRLGIQDPRGERGKTLGVATLSNAALVTSGDYEHFRMVDGVRYHHIIDPRTGWPATASISVTVVSSTAEQGVVLAKAIFILGAEKGLALARSQGVEALLVDPGQKIHLTPRFASLTGLKL